MSTKKNTPMSKAEEIELITKLAATYGDEPTYFCDAFGNATCAGTDAAIMIENIKNDLPILLSTHVERRSAKLEGELEEAKKSLEIVEDINIKLIHDLEKTKKKLRAMEISREQIIRDILIQWPEHTVIEQLVGVKERAEIKIENALPLSMDEHEYVLSLIEKDNRLDREISDDLAKLLDETES